MPNSVDNLDLQYRAKVAGVLAYEIAAELRVSESAVSAWIRGRRDTLPRGMGRSEYEAALEKLIAAKGTAA